MKKIFSIVLSLAVTLAMCVPMFSFAADTTYTITLTDSNPNHTYSAYQIFDGDLYEKTENGTTTKTLSNIVFGSGIDSTKTSAFLAEFKVGDSAPASAAALAKALEKGTLKTASGDAVTAKTFARIAANYTSTTKTDSNNSTITGLDAGYYLIKDTTEIAATETKDSSSAFIAQVVSNISVETKRGDVDLTKKVKDVNDTTSSTTLTDWQDSADWDIGDTIPFQLKAHLPENLDMYDAYKFVFHDTESAGLTFDANSVTVKIAGTVVDKSKYEVKTTGLASGETFNVVFTDIKTVAGAANNAEVTVDYNATLNSNAVLGSTGNPNEAWLEYSNNPNAEGSGTTSATPHDKVIVFTYKVHVNKVDENDQPLKGASFELFKKVDGNWVSKGVVDGSNATEFEWKGVDDGDYKIVETVVPQGYNSLDDTFFTVSATHSDGDNPSLTTLTGGTMFTGEVSTGTLTGTITNYAGSVLPGTGAAGTTMLYLVGLILLAGAGTIFVARRKAQAK